MENGKANLTVIPAGTAPLNPSYVLSQERIKRFLEGVADRYDYIVFDTPAVLENSSALSLPRLVDCVLMVVRSGLTPRRLALKAEKLLSKAESRIIGVVLNSVE